MTEEAEEIPQFLTCPICRRPQLSFKVVYDATLDGKKVKICGSCHQKHHIAVGKRAMLLQE